MFLLALFPRRSDDEEAWGGGRGRVKERRDEREIKNGTDGGEGTGVREPETFNSVCGGRAE